MATGRHRDNSTFVCATFIAHFLFIFSSTVFGAPRNSGALQVYFNQPVDGALAPQGTEVLGQVDFGSVIRKFLRECKGGVVVKAYEFSLPELAREFVAYHQKFRQEVLTIVDDEFLQEARQKSSEEMLTDFQRGRRIDYRRYIEQFDGNRDGEVSKDDIKKYNTRREEARETKKILEDGGVKVVSNKVFKSLRSEPTGITHEKFILDIEGGRTLLLTGNLTQTDFYGDLNSKGKLLSYGNHNSLMIIEDRDLTQWFLERARLMEAGRFGELLAGDGVRKFIVSGTPVEVLFSPAADIPVELAKRIRTTATRRARISAFWLTYPPVLEAIAENLAAYPAFRAQIVQDWSSISHPASLFEEAKALSRKYGTERFEILEFRDSPKDRSGEPRDKQHAKEAILEGGTEENPIREAYFGSANLTRRAGKLNNDVALIIRSEPIVESFAQRFEYLWRQAKKPTLTGRKGPIPQGYEAERESTIGTWKKKKTINADQAALLNLLRLDIISEKQLEAAMKSVQASGIYTRKPTAQAPNRGTEPQSANRPLSDQFATLRVGFTGNLGGRLFARRSMSPGGETEGEGGIAEAVSERRRRDFDLFVYSGNVNRGGGIESDLDHGRLANELLIGEGRIDAAVLGIEDLSRGAEGLKELLAAYRAGGTAVLSGNIRGIAGTEEAVIRQVRGVRVLLTGLSILDDHSLDVIRQQAGPGVVRVSDPSRTLARIRKKYAGKADAFVVIVNPAPNNRSGKIETIASESKGWDMMIVGGGFPMTSDPKVVRGTTVVGTGPEGKYLGETTLTFKRRPVARPQLVNVDLVMTRIRSGIAVEPSISARIDTYRKQVSESGKLFEPVAYLPFTAVAEEEWRETMRGRIIPVDLAGLLAFAVQEESVSGRKTDVTLIGRGSVRNSLPKGTVLRRDVQQTVAHESQAQQALVTEMTGAQLEDLFERAQKRDPMLRFALGVGFTAVEETIRGRQARLSLRYRGESLSPNQRFRVAIGGIPGATGTLLGAKVAHVGTVSLARSLENYLTKRFPLPTASTLKHSNPPPKVPEPRVEESARISPKADTIDLDRGALLWNYDVSTQSGLLTQYLRLTSELDRYARDGLKVLELAEAHYDQRKGEAKELAPNVVARMVKNAAVRGQDSKKTVDAVDPKKFDDVLSQLRADREAFLAGVNPLRAEIASAIVQAQEGNGSKDFEAARTKLNELRRSADERMTSLDLDRWSRQWRRMERAGDVVENFSYTIDEEFTKNARKRVESNYGSILAAIPDPEIREIAREVLARAPQYSWEIPAASSGLFHDPSQAMRGGNVLHTAGVAIDLLGKERSLARRALIEADIARIPYFRQMAERIGIDRTIDKLESVKLLGALTHDEFKHGPVGHQTEIPASRNARGEHTKFTGPLPGVPMNPPLPVGYGTRHEDVPPAFFRLLMKGDLQGRMDPYLMEWMNVALLHHAGQYSTGEAGASFEALRKTSFSHVHVSDECEANMMMYKVRVDGEERLILRGRTFPSTEVAPEFDPTTKRVLWRNLQNGDLYDQAFVEERWRGGDLTEVRGKTQEFDTPNGATRAPTYRLTSVNPYLQRMPKPLWIPGRQGQYFDITNPYAALDSEADGLPIPKNKKWNNEKERYEVTFDRMLPPARDEEPTSPMFRVTLKDGQKALFAAENDARRFATDRGEIEPMLEKVGPWTAPETKLKPPSSPVSGIQDYVVESPKVSFVERRFGDELSRIASKEIAAAARLALEIAPNYFEFIPAVPTGAREQDVGLRDFGGMVRHVKRASRALDELSAEPAQADGRLIDLARMGLLIRHAADHGWVDRQFDLPLSDPDPFRQTFGLAALGWPSSRIYSVTSPAGRESFTTYGAAEVRRKRLLEKYKDPGSVRLEKTFEPVVDRMFGEIVKSGGFSQADYRLLMDALKVAFHAEMKFRKPMEEVGGSGINDVSKLADLIVRAESRARDTTTRVRELVDGAGQARREPYYEGFSRNIVLEPFKASSGEVRYREKGSPTGRSYSSDEVKDGSAVVSVNGYSRKPLVKTLSLEIVKGVAIDGINYPYHFIQGKPSQFEPVLNQGRVVWRNLRNSFDALYEEPQAEWVPVRDTETPSGFWLIYPDGRREEFPSEESARRRKESVREGHARIEPFGYFVEFAGVRAYAVTEKEAKRLLRDARGSFKDIPTAEGTIRKAEKGIKEGIFEPIETKAGYGKQLEFLQIALGERKKSLERLRSSQMSAISKMAGRVRPSDTKPGAKRTAMKPPSPQSPISLNQIHEVERIVRMKGGEYGHGSVLVVFDFDNTLFAHNRDLGSEPWFRWQESLLGMKGSGAPERVADNRQELLKVWGKLLMLGETHPVEADTVERVKGIQRDGFPVIVETARGSLESSHMNAELRRHGLDFSKPSLHPTLRDGVILADGEHKGAVLRSLLDQTKSDIRAIVFVDDSRRNCERILEAFRGTGIDVTSVEYTRQHAAADTFLKGDKSDVVLQYQRLIRSAPDLRAASRRGNVEGSISRKAAISAGVKGTAQSGAMFVGQKIVADALVLGSDYLLLGLEELKDWRSFEDLRAALSRVNVVEVPRAAYRWVRDEGVEGVKDWIPLATVGGAAQTGIKVLYGTQQLGLGVRESLALRSVPMTGEWARAARVIPLWAALAGAELARTGSLSASSVTVGLVNVMAADAVAASLWRGGKVLRAGRGVREALRIATVARGAEIAPWSMFTLPERFGIGVIQFVVLEWVGRGEQALMEAWDSRQRAETAVEKLRLLHEASFTDSVAKDFRTKREEWAQVKFKNFLGALWSYVSMDREKMDEESATEMEDLESRAKGNLFRGPMSESEKAFSTYQIKATLDAKRSALRDNFAAAPARSSPIRIPLPVAPEVAGRLSRERDRYESDLRDAFEKQIVKDPDQFADQARQIVDSMLLAMEKSWTLRSLSGNTLTGAGVIRSNLVGEVGNPISSVSRQ